MNTYEHLFTPIKIGNTTVKNRIFMPPLSRSEEHTSELQSP